MGNCPDTPCAWNVATNGGKKAPSLTELQYDAAASSAMPGVYATYQCASCKGKVEDLLSKKYDPSVGWGGNVAI